jgi:ABC-type glycerol-3-phosphate transport system substrate-binding protein
MFMMDNGWTIPFIARGEIANLSNELDDSLVSTIRDTYIDTMVSTATRNGDLYGVPLFADFPVIQYRKDKVLEAGFSESELETWSTESMSWQQFSNVVADTMEANPEMRGYNFQGANYIGLSCCNFVEIMSAWGGSYFGDFENLFGPIGDRPVTVNEEPVVQAIRFGISFMTRTQMGSGMTLLVAFLQRRLFNTKRNPHENHLPTEKPCSIAIGHTR